MIRGRILLAFFGLLLLPGVVSAQSRIYGTLTCAQTTEQHSAPNPAKPGHILATMKQTCTWPEPISFGNFQTRDTQDTFQADIQDTHSDDTGSYLIHMTNGDQLTLKASGTSVLDASGRVRSLEGTWTLGDGTGALKGITGKGTYQGLPRAAGGAVYDIEGQYTLPSDVQPSAPLRPTPQQQMDKS